ncbi:transporter substrate-binding domain-containing protein [Mesorhizobium sp.]|uniref:transporter substrate-binding domain-containing protein n=1 Tax=Mesorhizobium sp. TaxID=1871066 RepID=UPI001222894C|nr:transporter substrate-binding domain-containing protein [Mesorhizobium sp.]TIS39145.1 MAG: transporter substrate-binding domain-containing protein [Mesorhizobium sp.]
MNKLMTLIAAAVSLAGASVASTTTANAGAVLDKVLEAKTLTVAVGTDWGTMSFLNDKHELDGFDIDVVKAIAEHLGVQAKFVTPGWDVIVAGKWQGRWDLAMGQMTPTKPRAEKFDFVTYFYSRSIAVVHKHSKATKHSDLDGKVVGATAGAVDEQYANHALAPDWMGAQPVEYQFTPGEVKAYESGDIMNQDLRLGDGVRLDAIVMTQESFPKMIASGFPFRQLGEPLFASPAAIAILRGDKEFSERIAAAINSMKDDGTLSKISMKWYEGMDYSTAK